MLSKKKIIKRKTGKFLNANLWNQTGHPHRLLSFEVGIDFYGAQCVFTNQNFIDISNETTSNAVFTNSQNTERLPNETSCGNFFEKYLLKVRVKTCEKSEEHEGKLRC